MKNAVAVAIVFALGIAATAAINDGPSWAAEGPQANASGTSSLIDVSLPGGTHYLRVVVSSDGTVLKAERVVPLKVGGSPVPPPQPPTNSFGFREALPSWIAAVSVSEKEQQQVLAGLSIAYATLAEQIESGQITDVQKAATAANQARATIYRTLGGLRSDWAPFEAKVVEKFGQLGQAGQLPDAAAVARAYSELSGVLSGDSDNAFAAMALKDRWGKFLSPELIELIIKLILQIIQALGD